MVAAFTNAIAMLGLHRLKGLNPWAIVAHYSGVASALVLAACFVGEPPDLSPLLKPRALALLLGLGVSATLGQVCVTRAFTQGQPMRISVVALVQILFALALDFLIDDIKAGPATIVGIALVIAPTGWMILSGLRGTSDTAPNLENSPTLASTDRLIASLTDRLRSGTSRSRSV